MSSLSEQELKLLSNMMQRLHNVAETAAKVSCRILTSALANFDDFTACVHGVAVLSHWVACDYWLLLVCSAALSVVTMP